MTRPDSERIFHFTNWLIDFGYEELKNLDLDKLPANEKIHAAYEIYNQRFPFPQEYYRGNEPDLETHKALADSTAQRGNSLPLFLILGPMLAILALLGLFIY